MDTNLEDFQRWVLSKMNPAVLNDKRDMMLSAVLGLTEESGEAAGHIKKHLFHFKEFNLHGFKKELGDVLFYLSLSASAAGIPLQDVFAALYEKLNTRYPNGFEASRAHAPGEVPSEERPDLSGESASGAPWPVYPGE